jgi:triacylglycerol lipase
MTAVLLLLLLAVVVGTWIWRWVEVVPPPQHQLEAPPWEPEAEEPQPDGAPAIVRRVVRPAVVLAHGLAGFDSLGIGELRIAYFRKVARRLERQGFDVVTTRVPPVGALPVRAAALATAVAKLPHDRVTIVGHSMGGLDARWAISHGLAARVCDLLTIGTPHRGTPLADILVRGPVGRTRNWMARLGLPTDAIAWLTTAKLTELASEMPDDPQVRYSSVVGIVQRMGVHPLLLAPHLYLSMVAGPNDGMVPAWSQRWGTVLLTERLDHFAQIGWAGGDSAGLVAKSLERLRLLPAGAVALGDPVALLAEAPEAAADPRTGSTPR